MANQGTTKLYCYDQDNWEDALNDSYRIESKEPGYKIVEGAFVLPLRVIPGTAAKFGNGLLEGGVCDKEGAFVAGQFRNADGTDFNRSCVRGYAPDSAAVEKRDEEVVFGGVLMSHWGHMLVDGTTRLWYAAQHNTDNRKIVFVMFPGQKFPYTEFLALAGVDSDSYEVITVPTQFKSVIVPDESFFSGSGNYTDRWIEFFNAMRDNVEPATHEKVYLSRTAFKIQNVLGEKYFENYFAKRGYHVVYPEKLSITEQVALMAGAKSVATTMGTISHLALFANEGTEFIILNRSMDIVKIQLAMNQARGIDCILVDAYRNFLPEKQGGNCPVLLAPNDNWNAMIADRFGDAPDIRYMEKEFPQLAYQYLQQWGDFFSDQSNFHWIRNRDTRELAWRVSTMVNGVQPDMENYEEPEQVERLRKRFQTAATSPMSFVPIEEIAVERGVCRLAGTVSFPFCPEGQMDVRCFMLLNDKNEKARLDIPVDATPVGKNGKLSWSTSFEMAAIDNAMKSFGLTAITDGRIRMAFSHGGEKHQYSMFAPEDKLQACAPYWLRADKALCFELVPDKVVAVEHEADAGWFLESVEATVVNWRSNVVEVKGQAVSTAIPHGGRIMDLGLDVMGVFYPLAKVEVTSTDDPYVLNWSASVSESQLRQAMAAIEEIPEIEGHTHRFSLSFELGETSSFASVKLGLSGEETEKLGMCYWVDDATQSLLLPTRMGDDFAVTLNDASVFIKRFWIEKLAWTDKALKLEGDFRTKSGDADGLKLSLALSADGVRAPLVDVEQGVLDEARFSWKAEISRNAIAKALAELQKSQTFTNAVLTLVVDIKGLVGFRPVGRERKPGTIKNFACTRIQYSQARFALPHGGEGDNLVFEAIGMSDAPRILARKIRRRLK